MSRSRRRAASARGGAGSWRGVALAGGALLLSLLIVGVGVASALQRGLRSDRISQGVRVSGVSVGGMTAPQALEALRPAAGDVGKQPVELSCGEDHWTVSRSELGVSLDMEATVGEALDVGHRGNAIQAWRDRRKAAASGVDLDFTVKVDRERLNSALLRLASKVLVAAKPASVIFNRETHGIHIDKGKIGRALDAAATAESIERELGSLRTAEVEIVVTERRVSPTYDDLKHINAVVGTFNTKYAEGESNRSSNIRLAASKLNGKFLEPGARLSYNQTVGQRTEAAGFKKAHVYEEGEVRDGIGGGICQVSTTLYNAALIAGLKIIQRRPHMMPVAYVPTGRDATVDWNSGIDLVVENCLAHSVQLLTFSGGGSLTVLFVGAASDKPEKVEIVRSAVATDSFATTKIPDSSLPAGEIAVDTPGRSGHSVTVHRVIKRAGGAEKKELLSHDVYAKRNEVVRIGPDAPEEPAEDEHAKTVPGASKAPAKPAGSDNGSPGPQG